MRQGFRLCDRLFCGVIHRGTAGHIFVFYLVAFYEAIYYNKCEKPLPKAAWGLG